MYFPKLFSETCVSGLHLEYQEFNIGHSDAKI